jgi:DNA polymerase-3 subunit alpha (Gram-positive type)
MFDYVCFDLETGGLDENKNPITEFACIVYCSESFEEKFRFESFIKPYDNLILEEGALKHTGINLEMLETGILINELVDLLSEVFKTFTYGSSRFKYKPILVGHNICKFDIPFVKYAFNRQGLNLHDYVEHYSEDTLFLGRTKWKGEINKFNLEACCKAAGIELIDAHRAMNDVEANKKLHEFLIKTLRQKQSISVQSESEQKTRKTFKF